MHQQAAPKIFIAAGHGGNDPGAVNQDLGLVEKKVAQRLRDKVTPRLQAYGAQVDNDPNYMDTHEAVRHLKRSGTPAYDLVLDLHLNAYDGTAQGVLTVHANNAWNATRKRAKSLSDALAQALGQHNRGACATKDLNRPFKRLPILNAQQGATNLLLEAEFIDHNNAIQRWLDQIDDAAQIIADQLAEHLELCEPAKPKKSKKQATANEESS
jgi:N-acetylmuramoyl-L-alanine amidase